MNNYHYLIKSIFSEQDHYYDWIDNIHDTWWINLAGKAQPGSNPHQVGRPRKYKSKNKSKNTTMKELSSDLKKKELKEKTIMNKTTNTNKNKPKRKYKTTPPPITEDIINQYKNGLTMNELSKKYNISLYHFRNYIRQNNISNPNILSNENKELIIKLYTIDQLSINKISKQINKNKKLISKIIKANNIKIRTSAEQVKITPVVKRQPKTSIIRRLIVFLVAWLSSYLPASKQFYKLTEAPPTSKKQPPEKDKSITK